MQNASDEFWEDFTKRCNSEDEVDSNSTIEVIDIFIDRYTDKVQELLETGSVEIEANGNKYVMVLNIVKA